MISAAAIAFSAFQLIGSPPTAHAATSYYVSTSGSDSNSGTSTGSAFKTLQKAANTAGPGDTVNVLAGTYNQKLKITNSGTSSAPITFRNYNTDVAVIDGTGLPVSGMEGIVQITNASNIKVQGFEIRNYKTSTNGNAAVGIFATGSGSNIEIRNNNIHHIASTATPAGSDREGRDAHGIAVYGTSTTAFSNVTVDGNTLANLTLGSSEALVLNGNVDGFSVTNNTIHHSDNIGIDIIGFEGKAPNESVDQARNGVVSGNLIYNVSVQGNPSYPSTDYSAGGIYVDGGKNVVIERNRSYNNDIGIEVASEWPDKSTSYITVRNNLAYNNSYTGIAIGGYDTNRGSTTNSKIVNNTLYNNDLVGQEGGQLLVQYDTRNNIIKNNIMVASSSKILIQNQYTQNTGNVVDYNLYYGVGGTSGLTWNWKTSGYTSFSTYKSSTGNDAHSAVANPLFVSPTTNFTLSTGSPAINAGHTDTAIIGSTDLAGLTRVLGGTVEIGAYEKQ
ncbi:right-handed parallel beta-helix repeat-containing protein [Paenibacillus pasadenensis]|uniref:right-handed parallel beta-helix repeat-containing protein n=1 Tax=Paenibacillus pasadenensis TaxID=217090 RepID=UPI003EBD18D8